MTLSAGAVNCSAANASNSGRPTSPCGEQVQAANLRQRCLDELSESRMFVKRSRTSLVGIAKQSGSNLVCAKEHQMGYQPSLIGCATFTASVQGRNLIAGKSTVRKNIHINVKKLEQQKRKQAGILICRHLVAALRIQAAHDQNAISS